MRSRSEDSRKPPEIAQMFRSRLAAVVAAFGLPLLVGAPLTASGQATAQRLFIAEKSIRASVEDLSEVAETHLLPNGALAIVQRQDSRIVVFDSSGRRLYAVGRPGAGPGEFARERAQSSMRAGVFGDTLWAYDPMLRRFALFAGERLAKTLPLHAALSFTEASLRDRRQAQREVLLGLNPYAMRSSERMLGIGEFGLIREIGGEMHGRDVRRAVVRAGFKSGEAAELLRLPHDSAMVTVSLNKDSTSTRMMRVPYRRPIQTEFSDDGTRFATIANHVDGDAPTITLSVYNDDGKQQYSRSWPLPAVRVTRRMVDSVLDFDRRNFQAMFTGRMAAAGARAASKDEQLAAEARKRAPRFASVHLQINFTADGYVWIGVPRSTAMKDLELLDGTGKTVLSASLPPGHSLTNGTRSTVWTVSSDSDDLPVLTRFRVKQ